MTTDNPKERFEAAYQEVVKQRQSDESKSDAALRKELKDISFLKKVIAKRIPIPFAERREKIDTLMRRKSTIESVLRSRQRQTNSLLAMGEKDLELKGFDLSNLPPPQIDKASNEKSGSKEKHKGEETGGEVAATNDGTSNQIQTVKTVGQKNNPQIVPTVELSKAGKFCFKKSQRKKYLSKIKLIDICREYLSKHKIKGKPDYTPELLSNYCLKSREKL